MVRVIIDDYSYEDEFAFDTGEIDAADFLVRKADKDTLFICIQGAEGLDVDIHMNMTDARKLFLKLSKEIMGTK
jgi:hypothetical protein